MALFFWAGVSAFLGFLCYGLIGALQRQSVLQAQTERRLEAANERTAGELGLLQTQLDRLEEETFGDPLDDIDLRLLRAQLSLTHYERSWGLSEVKQVLRMRIRVLTALKHGQN